MIRAIQNFLKREYRVEELTIDPQIELSSSITYTDDGVELRTTPAKVLTENLQETGKWTWIPSVLGFYLPFLTAITHLDNKGKLDNPVVRGIANGLAGIVGVGLGAVGALLTPAFVGIAALKNQGVDTANLFHAIATDKLVVETND